MLLVANSSEVRGWVGQLVLERAHLLVSFDWLWLSSNYYLDVCYLMRCDASPTPSNRCPSTLISALVLSQFQLPRRVSQLVPAFTTFEEYGCLLT